MKRPAMLAGLAGAALLAGVGTATAAVDAQAACERTVLAYADAWDHHDGAAFASLFTDDAVLDLGTGPVRGKAAITELFAKRNPPATTRHLMSNIVVTPTGAGAAKGVSYLQLFAAPGAGAADGKPMDVEGYALVGEYQDSFRLTPAGCRFADRKLVNVFRRARPPGPASGPPPGAPPPPR